MELEQHGQYFQEFSIGDVFQSGPRVISENDLVEFAELTGDKNRIHLDPVFAEQSIYGQRVAHGLLTLSVVSGLAVETGFARDTAAALRNLSWKFGKPVMIGDVISATFIVREKKDIKNQKFGLIRFSVEVVNQHKEKVQNGSWSLLILKK